MEDYERPGHVKEDRKAQGPLPAVVSRFELDEGNVC